MMSADHLCGVLVAAWMLSAGTALSQVDHRYSGSWFDPERAGEGFVIQILDSERANITWFTYPPSDTEAQQAWMTGVGTISGNSIVVEDVVQPIGASFGSAFDPDDVELRPWGRFEFTFEDCDQGSVAYEGPAEFGTGTIGLSRLTSLAGLDCDGPVEQVRLRSGWSGAHFDTEHAGEGWMLEVLPDGTSVIYWFTYEPDGKQAWLIGIGEVAGSNFWFGEMLQGVGTFFGEDFRREDVVLEPWGELGLAFDGCDSSFARYESDADGYGSGTYTVQRLAHLAATDCEPPPAEAARVNGQWRLAGTQPAPRTSETGSTAIGDSVYLGGDFGSNSRSFRRYRPGSDSWTTLEDLPQGRHHLGMTDYDGAVYLLGGLSGAGFSVTVNTNFWRFDPGLGSWETLEPMPTAFGSGGAVTLFDRIYAVSGETLDLKAHDPRRGGWEILPSPRSFARDHSQAAAFEGEIWLMGGRTPLQTRVQIYNPIRREWRNGPALNQARSGFAAAVVQGQLMVAGGESLDPLTVFASAEILAPGADEWVMAPPMPSAIHGADGAVVDGELIVLGGSTIPGSGEGSGLVQIYSPGE